MKTPTTDEKYGALSRFLARGIICFILAFAAWGIMNIFSDYSIRYFIFHFVSYFIIMTILSD